MTKVVLVIGHTEKSPGACNITNNICEFEFNKKLAKGIVLINDVINDNRCKIDIIYRDSYKDLPGKINKLNPDFVICLHNNAFNTRVTGSETLYYHKSKKGKKMASIFQDEIVKALKSKDRGIKGKSSEERGGYILKYTKAPCILIEPFFIDNDSDYRNAVDRYPKLIMACSEAIYEIIDTV